MEVGRMQNEYFSNAEREHFELSQALLANQAFVEKVNGWEAPRIMLKCQRGHRLFNIEIFQHDGSKGLRGVEGMQRLEITTRDGNYYEPENEVSKNAEPDAENRPFQHAICVRVGCKNAPAENRSTCDEHGALVGNAVAAMRQKFLCQTCLRQGKKPEITLKRATILGLYAAAVNLGKKSIQIEGYKRI